MEVAAVKAAGAAASLSMADVDYDDTGKKKDPKFSLMSLATIAMAGGSTVMWILSLATSYGVIVLAGSLVSFLVAPIALYQRHILNSMDGFRQIHNKLRNEVGKLTGENDELEQNVDSLADQANKVKEVEGQLGDIAAQQGSNVNQLVGLVKENGELQKEMEELLKGQVMEQVMGIILMSDRDQDFHLDDMEINMLMMRIKGVPGVDGIDEDKFRQMLNDNPGVGAIMNLWRDMEENPDKKVIQVSTKNLK